MFRKRCNTNRLIFWYSNKYGRVESMIVEFPYSLFSERGLRETTLWGPKRPENVPVAHFQRRPGGSPEPKATLTVEKRSQNEKDAQRCYDFRRRIV